MPSAVGFFKEITADSIPRQLKNEKIYSQVCLMLIISTASCTFYSLAVSTQSASIMGGQHNSLPHSYADGRGVRADWRAVCL